jgi:glycerol-3-phosphate O-acyltransferase
LDSMKALTPKKTHASAMLKSKGGLFGWLGRRAFSQIRVDDETVERLLTLPDRGELVYVMRTRSALDYLYFNHLFLRIGLPLAVVTNGVNLNFFRGIRVWARGLWAQLTGRAPQARSEDFAQAAAVGHASLLFMKTVALRGDRPTTAGHFEGLLAQQRQQARPILLLPQHLTWPRKPPSQRRTWIDVLFGHQEASGRLRKIGYFLRHRRAASVQVGEPIDLAQVISDHPEWNDARLARKVRRVLFVHLAREAMAIHGPKVKPPALIRQEVLDRKRFQTELREAAEQQGISLASAQDRARRYIKEIAATTRFEPIEMMGWALDRVFGRIFQGVEVDEAGVRLVKDAARLSRSAPLILLPSHKSHMDYLVISWLFLRNEFIPPHVAAGANLNFFPVGGLLRRMGAFYLRRSFHGLPLYRLVFRRYLWKLVREGYPIEFYMEGGRSRTGKLLQPKMGMLAMLLEGVQLGEYKDLQFVPINLSYERVVETASYKRELTGGQKSSESVKGVVKAGKVLRARYGRIYVSFEEPVRLTTWLTDHGVDVATLDEVGLRDATKRLAYHLMRRIQVATTVSPSQLVGAVLMSHSRRGLSAARLRERVGFLIGLLAHRKARLSRSIQHRLKTHATAIATAEGSSPREAHHARGEALRPLLDESMGLLRKLVQTVDRGGEGIYVVPEKSRIELDYYRNAILSILAPETIVATALLAAGRPMARRRLLGEVKRLSSWFRLEFIYETELPLPLIFDQTLAGLVQEGFVSIDERGQCAPAAPLTLEFLAGMLRHLVEGYWIAADALRGLVHGEMSKKEWLEFAQDHGEREFLEGDIQRPEAVSTAVLGNALELFRQEGLVRRSERSGGRKPVFVFSLARDRNLEHVAFRRDDLGFFLNRPAETLVPAAEQPPLDEPSRPPTEGERPMSSEPDEDLASLLGPLSEAEVASSEVVDAPAESEVVPVETQPDAQPEADDPPNKLESEAAEPDAAEPEAAEPKPNSAEPKPAQATDQT